MSVLEEPNGVLELFMLLKSAVNTSAVSSVEYAQIFQINIICEVLGVHLAVT
jgi:hypothetical protein